MTNEEGRQLKPGDRVVYDGKTYRVEQISRDPIAVAGQNVVQIVAEEPRADAHQGTWVAFGAVERV